MSLEKLLRWMLTSLLFISEGLGQSPSPSQCVKTFQIEQDRTDLYIMPGRVNCFSCALDSNGTVAWQVDNVDGDLVPVSSSHDAIAFGNFLVLAIPENYVLPGTSGRRSIFCTSVVDGQSLGARLASPILQQPVFSNVNVNEGDLLKITCVTRNIPDITTFEVLDPNGMPVPTVLGVFSVPNVTRAFAGTYTCVVTSTLDISTVNETSVVIVEYAPEVTASSSSTHNVVLGEELYLYCSFVGIPAPSVFWYHNDELLSNGVNDVTINYLANNSISLMICSVNYTSGGTYNCSANNTLGTDQDSYTVRTVLVLDHTQSISCQCTTAITFTGVLSILLAVCVVVFASLAIVVVIKRNRQLQTKSDVYYDTVNIGHHSKPPTVNETEVNVAYGHTRST